MNTPLFEHGKSDRAGKKLAEALAGIGSDLSSFISTEENEMLSLIVDETLKGVDIETRYPDFYQKLFGNAALRQVFLETLESVEAEKAGALLPFPAVAEPKLTFLTRKAGPPRLQKLEDERWQIKLQKTIQELQNIFSPPALAYRSDANLFDDNWFTVLREEIEVDGSTYSILLECSRSQETEEALSAALNLAMTLEPAAAASQPSIQVTLQWGKYTETVAFAEEGRARFPDIPFSATFDQQDQRLLSGLDLLLEINPAPKP
jgi:hypothetical protein